MQQVYRIVFVVQLFIMFFSVANAQTQQGDTTAQVQTIRLGECTCTAKGFKVMGPVQGYWDSSYFPHNLMYVMQIANMKGIDVQLFKKGKTGLKLFDLQKMAIKLPGKVNQYAVKTSAEGGEMKLRLHIPMNPNDSNLKKYTFRYRWEHAAARKEFTLTCTLKRQDVFL